MNLTFKSGGSCLDFMASKTAWPYIVTTAWWLTTDVKPGPLPLSSCYLGQVPWPFSCFLNMWYIYLYRSTVDNQVSGKGCYCLCKVNAHCFLSPLNVPHRDLRWSKCVWAWLSHGVNPALGESDGHDPWAAKLGEAAWVCCLSTSGTTHATLSLL